MTKGLHHVAIAVKDLDNAVELLKTAFGVEVSHIEEVPEQKVRVAFVPLGDTRLEIMEPTSEDSTVAKFLTTRGEGLHHLALATDDAGAALEHAGSSGLRLIDREPRDGAHGTRVGFVHPKSTFGVLFELVQDKH